MSDSLARGSVTELTGPAVARTPTSRDGEVTHRIGEPERIVIVGAGFGGYFAARKLARKLRPSKAHITVISDVDGLLYQPLLPEVAVGALDPRAIVVPLATTLKGVHLIRGRVDDVDLDLKTVSVVTASGTTRRVPFDRLLLTPGGVTRVFDIPGLHEHALGFKTVAEALYLRDLLLQRMEQANDETDPAARQKLLSFVVVGAGYAGTELVAQLARMSTRLLKVFPLVRATDLRWMLLDMAPTVMPELGPSLGLRAVEILQQRGIDVRLGTSISKITRSAATLTDGTRVDGATVVWCAGVAPNPLMASTGLATVRGRLVVDAELRVHGRADIYAVGDAAAVPNLRGLPDRDGAYPLCPPTAQHAMRQGRTVARNISADVRGRSRRAYRHRDLGLVVDLGGPHAVARPLGLALRGRPAKIVTRCYHVFALPTTRRRLRALAGWLLSGSTPDDVAFGLALKRFALAANEHVGVAVPGTAHHRGAPISDPRQQPRARKPAAVIGPDAAVSFRAVPAATTSSSASSRGERR